MREETCCRHMGYSFRLTARVILYAPSHRQDSTYHSLCYTSCGALAGMRNSIRRLLLYLVKLMDCLANLVMFWKLSAIACYLHQPFLTLPLSLLATFTSEFTTISGKAPRDNSVHSWCDGSSDRSFIVDPLGYFSFQPVPYDCCNKVG